ncbi:Autophagy-related protein 11 [Psilocybe cubensis]|uniref:Autophagy-related protein 11 n=1 Tax=Psilocybe cubensis TaxID=181762 RepID=A0ACB8GRV0_PSICU|nr:Autophagy-related protein 11 [Psilocybe cubensis]KAH9478358.1 Autophagy-related protein 11 [Psilocybe cubensis]
MITICRAEDGQVFQVNASVRDIEGTGSLEQFLQQETGIEADAALAFLSDGRRLTTGNIRDLSSAQDQYIFVFNQDLIESNLEDSLNRLIIEPPFQAAIEDSTATPPIRHAALATSYARTAQIHHEHIQHILRSLSLQHQALQIASTSLDYHILQIYETFDAFASNGRKELEKQASLLEGLDADLDILSKVGVHVEFCSTAVRMAIEAGEKPRVLTDYVSKLKMRQVADGCAKTHEDLKSRFQQVEDAVNKLKHGADSVRNNLANALLFDEASTCARRSEDLLNRITDASAALESPASDTDSLLQDLRHLDSSHRLELQEITHKKNLYTRQCLTVLRHIAALNNDIVNVPPALAALVVSFRGKTSFSHIQRLHNMLYAYGATVIEIVRRKEFSRFFFQRAQSILEVMAKVSANERKRRQVYRGEVHGQLPFETKGLDDPVPTIDFTPSGGTDFVYSFERADVDNLIRVLDDLEQYSRASQNSVALKAVRECRFALEKLIGKMDNLELGFDKIAERSLLSRSHISQSRRRSTEIEEQAIQELADELRTTQEAKALQEQTFNEDKLALQAEIRRLSAKCLESDASLSLEQERSARLERELQQVRGQMESEAVARRILEQRNAELDADISKQRTEIADALADATEQTRQAEMLRQELAQVQEEVEEVKQLEKRNADTVARLMEEQTKNLRNLEEARARGEDLELQIQTVRSESDQLHQALRKASQEKDKLLRDQASEHEMRLRDHKAEADGDRAVLDRQFSELQAVLEHKERQLKDVRGDLEVANADAVGLRQELQRVEHELRDARELIRVHREDLKAGQASQHEYEQRIENSNRLIAQILDVAITFRNTHVKALHIAQSISSHPSSTRHTSANLAESAFSMTGFRHNVIGQPDEPSPIDPSDPNTALETLREFDHDHFLEAVTKTGTIIRKWQKQCKEYRERAKGKISFRNFAKGDLALFLPTRNSATGHLAEQLKTREWIVARITSITERIVDQKDPSSNPYGLGDGVKYYMLEVEDWTQPTNNKRRLSSRKISGADNETKEVFPTGAVSKLSPSALPPGPPEAEVEETFLVTHPPNSHLFPVRGRSNSSPTARPSSLSRLLAQASPAPETSIETSAGPDPEIKSPSPHASPPPASSPQIAVSVPQSVNVNSNHSSMPSPLRPGSRASRLSTTSRFSVGRGVPVLSTGGSMQSKAAPTTALSEQPMASSPSSSAENPFMSPTTPSPEESISDALKNIVTLPNKTTRPRTTSYQTSRPSPLAATTSQATVVPSRPSLAAAVTTNPLTSLANSWGMSFGRKKKTDTGNLTPTAESSNDGAERESEPTISDNPNTSHSAREMLKRF